MKIGFFKINRSYKDFVYIVGIFLLWRLLITISVILAAQFIPLHSTDRYLGGGVRNYLLLPQFFAWGNFDGEHYLSIALSGYKYLEQAFFPIYPIILGFVTRLTSDFFFRLIPDQSLYLTFAGVMWGLIISNFAFLLALIMLWELIERDWGRKVAFLTIVLITVFPTSFFFGAVYTESLFFLFIVLSFYFFRNGNWLLAGLFGAISSATRVFGFLLLPSFELVVLLKRKSLFKTSWIFLIPIGILGYMYFLWKSSGDPLAFYHLQTVIGEQHQSGIITLPQDYLRYIKMLLSVSPRNPIYQTLVLEFLTGLIFFLLPIYGFFKKIPWDYLFFSLVGFLLPTIQGSFSSSPRYILVLFPSFLCAAIFLKDIPKIYTYSLIIFLLICLLVETAMFSVGFWIA